MSDNLARRPALKVIEGAQQAPLAKRPTATALIPELTEATPGKPEPLGMTAEARRWLTSAGLVLLIYAAPVAWWLMPDRAPGVVAPPPAAMVVELAPAPVAPPSPANMPPGPEQAEATPPPKPEPIPEPEPEPEIPPAPKAEKPEVAVAAEPEPEPEPEEKPKLEQPLSEEPEDTPPREEPPSSASAPPDALQEDAQAASPNVGVFSPQATAQRKLTWQNALMLKLNESKQYPSRARRLRQEGVAYVRFTMDREGKVLAKSIEQSAGYPMLDEETLALLDRAQPLPIPPPEMTGDQLEFVVPVEFFLRR